MTGIRNSFIVRHWKGELPLWVSCLIAVFVVGLLELLVLNIIKNVLAPADANDPSRVLAAVIVSWAFIATVGVWQVVGVWRASSRQRHADGAIGKARWASVARLAIVALVGVAICAFAFTGWPSIRRLSRIVSENDPSIADYALSLSRSGTVLEIQGGMKFGVSRDVRRILEECRDVKTVELDSASGRYVEAIALARLIRERRLETYVEGSCNAGCALAFMAGTRRWFRTGAHLGFAQVYGPADEDVPIKLVDDEFRAAFERVSAGSDFVTMALYGSGVAMWYPDEDTLRRNGIVTDNVDASSTIATARSAGGQHTLQVGSGIARDCSRK
jgi:hypothetical protein